MNLIPASVVLTAYNQENFIEAALQSLLDQDYENLEIVVSDDCSQDRTWEKLSDIAKAYAGNKRIILNRNSKNLGIGANYAKAFSLTTGDVIFSAAGDDISLNSRCSESINAWQASGQKVDLVATDAFDMMIDGEIAGIKEIDDLHYWKLKDWFIKRPYHFGATHMMTRRLVAVNPLSRKLNAEDQCLMFRSLLMGGAVRIAKPLVMYRRNGVSYKVKATTHALKKDRFINDAKASLIESQQMLSDANCLAREIEVRKYLDIIVNVNTFILEILTAPSLADMYRIFSKANTVPLSKRLRFFLFSAFPFFYVFGIWLKSFNKK